VSVRATIAGVQASSEMEYGTMTEPLLGSLMHIDVRLQHEASSIRGALDIFATLR